MNPITELTLDEIAERFGVSVDKLKIKKWGYAKGTPI